MKKTSKEKKMKEEIIVLYPAPGIGHLISMVELAKHFINTTTFSITILLTTNSPDDTLAAATYIQAISQTSTSITFRHLPPLLTPTTTSPKSGAAVLFDFIRRNVPNVRHALQCISTTHIIKAFVIDLFCTSALSVAQDLRIPVYYFFTSGAAVLGCFLFFPTVDKQIGNQSYKDLKTTFLEFPGLPLIPATHVPEPLLDRDDPAFADFMYFCKNLSISDGIIVNTFRDLEPISVSTLASGSCLPNSTTTPPIYYIGPLISSMIKKDSTFDNKITPWLNSQPKQNVVYLCFGSRGSCSTTQLQEIAIGLENSKQRFLWVIKSDEDDDVLSLLPEGFLNRTEGRGMVVTSWVRQAEILNHDSVGGFVTHCGWNSVLEAVVGGVPMVTWPLYAEQKLNKAVLVEMMKIGIALEMDKEDGFVSGSELEKKVRILMDFEEIRVRCLKMKEMAMDAWSEAGSSTADLDQLVELWKHNAQTQF